MLDTMIKQMHRLAQGFNLRDLQNFRTLVGLMTTYEFSIDDILRYIAIREMCRSGSQYKGCPNCAFPMVLSPVNTEPSNMVGGPWRSMWFCERCGEDMYSSFEADQEVKTALVLEDTSLPLPEIYKQNSNYMNKLRRDMEERSRAVRAETN